MLGQRGCGCGGGGVTAVAMAVAALDGGAGRRRGAAARAERLKEDVVVGEECVLVRRARELGEASAIGGERVVHLADGVEDAACGRQPVGAHPGHVARLGRDEQVGVLGEQELNKKEERSVEEREGLVDG